MNQEALILVVFLVIGLKTSCSEFVFLDGTLYDGSPCVLPDGKIGVCSENCTQVLTSGRTFAVCSYRRDNVVVCCPERTYPKIEKVCANRVLRMQELNRQRIEIEDEALRLEEEKEREWQQAVEDYMKNCHRAAMQYVGREKRMYVEQCERNAPRRNFATMPDILPAAPQEHPHMAALGWINRLQNTTEWYCGGSLIHPSYVLTAAHCIHNVGTPDVVRVSDVELMSTFDDEHAAMYDVVSVEIYKGYLPANFYNDIALIRIVKQPDSHPVVMPLPACLWPEEEPPSKPLLVLGYGAPAFSRAHNNKLYKGNLTIFDNNGCERFYENLVSLPSGILTSQICAHDPTGVMDTCEGDSGGPLQFNANDEFKTPYLVGITSFGIMCLDGNPGVYTKIYSYFDWIEDNISDE